jgi:hypothetical protein
MQNLQPIPAAAAGKICPAGEEATNTDRAGLPEGPKPPASGGCGGPPANRGVQTKNNIVDLPLLIFVDTHEQALDCLGQREILVNLDFHDDRTARAYQYFKEGHLFNAGEQDWVVAAEQRYGVQWYLVHPNWQLQEIPERFIDGPKPLLTIDDLPHISEPVTLTVCFDAFLHSGTLAIDNDESRVIIGRRIGIPKAQLLQEAVNIFEGLLGKGIKIKQIIASRSANYCPLEGIVLVEDAIREAYNAVFVNSVFCGIGSSPAAAPRQLESGEDGFPRCQTPRIAARDFAGLPRPQGDSGSVAAKEDALAGFAPDVYILFALFAAAMVAGMLPGGGTENNPKQDNAIEWIVQEACSPGGLLQEYIEHKMREQVTSGKLKEAEALLRLALKKHWQDFVLRIQELGFESAGELFVELARQRDQRLWSVGALLIDLLAEELPHSESGP